MKLFDFDRLLETLTNYLETKLEIFKIDLKEEIGLIIAKMVVYLSIVLLGIVAIIFGLGALGAWLNVQLESAYLGYLIDFGVVLLILVFVINNQSKVVDSVLTKMKKSNKNEEVSNND